MSNNENGRHGKELWRWCGYAFNITAMDCQQGCVTILQFFCLVRYFHYKFKNKGCFFLYDCFEISFFPGNIYVSSNFTLPKDMLFGEAQIISIITYSILFIIGLSFNTISLRLLFREKRKNKMTLLLIHLSIADLMVSIFRTIIHN